MAVERLTDYTRRIWTALDADAPENHDIQVNDVIYYMDSSQCAIVTYVYPAGSIDVEFLPDVGGNQILTWHLNVVNGTTQGTTSQRNIIVLSDYDSDLQCIRRRSIGVRPPNRIISIPQALRTTPANGITQTVVLIAIHKDLPSPGYSVEGDVAFYGEISGAPELGSNYNSYIFAVYGDNAKITITN